MEGLVSASHQDVLLLLGRVLILLLSARTLGEIAARLGQPAVVGEILAGVILGPSFLSGLFPQVGAWILPQTSTQLQQIEVFSLLGALFLLILTGIETDIPLIRRMARRIAGVAAGGLILPFATGFVMAWMLPKAFLGERGDRTVFALFVATAMSISAIPVIAKVLMDLRLMRRNIGQSIMAAAMMDDTMAWILLSIVLGLASQGELTATSVGLSGLKVLGFMGISFALGRSLADRVLRTINAFRSPEAVLSLVVMSALLWGAMAQALGIEAVLGAFIVGIIFGDLHRFPEGVARNLEGISLGVFSPIFFAVAGLKVDVRRLMNLDMILVAGIVVAVAALGKIVGAYIGGRLVRAGHWNSLAFGAALNARGAVELIIASIGLSYGILSRDMYSVIVVMAILTSLMAPPMLRWVTDHLVPDSEEERRLKQEEILGASPFPSLDRILFPVRIDAEGASSRIVEAGLLNLLGAQERLRIDLLNIPARSTEQADGLAYLRKVRPLFHSARVQTRAVVGRDPASVIVQEARQDFDLLVLGAPRGGRHEAEGLFNPIIDGVVRAASCPTLVISKTRVPWEWSPRRILVPVNGSAPSRHAAGFAFRLAGRSAVVVLVNVLEEERKGLSGIFANPFRASHLEEIQRGIVAEVANVAASFDVTTEQVVLSGRSFDREILRYAQQNRIDFILLGTGIRSGTNRLFYGQKVENIVHGAHCPVGVLNVNA